MPQQNHATHTTGHPPHAHAYTDTQDTWTRTRTRTCTRTRTRTHAHTDTGTDTHGHTDTLQTQTIHGKTYLVSTASMMSANSLLNSAESFMCFQKPGCSLATLAAHTPGLPCVADTCSRSTRDLVTYTPAAPKGYLVPSNKRQRTGHTARLLSSRWDSVVAKRCTAETGAASRDREVGDRTDTVQREKRRVLGIFRDTKSRKESQVRWKHPNTRMPQPSNTTTAVARATADTWLLSCAS